MGYALLTLQRTHIKLTGYEEDRRGLSAKLTGGQVEIAGRAVLFQRRRRYNQFHRRQSRYQLPRSAAQMGEDNETG